MDSGCTKILFSALPHIYLFIYLKRCILGENSKIYMRMCLLGENKDEEVDLGQTGDRSECQAKDLRHALLSRQTLMKILSRTSHILGIFS